MLKRREMDWSNEWVKEYPQSLQAVWFCTANVKSLRKKRELFCVINSPHRKSHMASLQYNSLCTGYRYQQIEDQKKKAKNVHYTHRHTQHGQKCLKPQHSTTLSFSLPHPLLHKAWWLLQQIHKCFHFVCKPFGTGDCLLLFPVLFSQLGLVENKNQPKPQQQVPLNRIARWSFATRRALNHQVMRTCEGQPEKNTQWIRLRYYFM